MNFNGIIIGFATFMIRRLFHVSGPSTSCSNRRNASKRDGFPKIRTRNIVPMVEKAISLP